MGGRTYRGHVVQRFPERSRDIAALVLTSEDFRALCNDYADAVEALRRWQAATAASDARARIEEFRQLVADLEDEILAELGRAGGRPCS